jgi:hypothetical protein
MKKQSVITFDKQLYMRHKKLDRSSIVPKLSMICFLRKHKDKQFLCGHNILTEALFETQLSSHVGISG